MDPHDTQPRRLRLVDPEHDQTGPQTPDDELTSQQAAAFAALVADGNQAALGHTLDQMSNSQLRTLAVGLATHLNAAETATGDVPDVGPEGACAIAVATAAQSFGTTREAVLSADRHRAVTDARAVAMTAARRGGMTLPSIAAYFGKDHTTVMYAQNKVKNNPRLNAVCGRIVDRLEEHYQSPARTPGEEDPGHGEERRSTTLQLAALERAPGPQTSRRPQDPEPPQRAVTPTAPAR